MPEKFLTSGLLGEEDRQAFFLGYLPDRRRGQLSAPARGAVRLSHHPNDVVTLFGESP
jgi:hypothetical protein